MTQRYRAHNSRRFPRLQASYLVKVMRLDDFEPLAVANTKDLSLGGVRFSTRAPLEEGSLVRITVLLPTELQEVSAIARVLKSRPAQGKDYSTVILQFVEMANEDQKLLKDLIFRLLGTREAKHLFDEEEIVTRIVGEESVKESA
ncbi:MAG: PilZ domain-containing protein [Candidatus Omnitrophota bacterium]|nr:PilZ domain-containing protein [Candidatus Omnitrophota bacterium]